MPNHRERKLLKEWLTAGARISWEVPHASQQAVKRGVPIYIAERVVRAGAVTRAELLVSGVERWTCSGHDPDGCQVEVIVEAEPAVILVITVIRIDP